MREFEMNAIFSDDVKLGVEKFQALAHLKLAAEKGIRFTGK